jgi:hypothetical protein
MSEIPDQNDPPAVLSYATAKIGVIQPADSRFVCEYHEDGITLTEPGQAWEAVSQIVLGVILVLLGVVPISVGIYRNWSEAHGREHAIVVDTHAVIFSCIAAAIGIVLLVAGQSELGRPFVIEVRNGRLSRSRRSTLSWRRSWPTASIVGIKVSLGTPSLPSGRLYSNLLVSRRWRFSMPILESRPKDECLWMARVLRDAMKLPPAPED